MLSEWDSAVSPNIDGLQLPSDLDLISVAKDSAR